MADTSRSTVNSHYRNPLHHVGAVVDIFLHIPKTGGRTATTALKWVYGPGSCGRLPSDESTHPAEISKILSRRKVQEADLLYGHVLFGLHRHLNCRCRYFTLLRDPVRRVVSHYFYHKARYPDTDLASLTLQSFLRSEHPVAQSNRQVRFLSGRNLERNPQAALEDAKRHLETAFAAFGVTERFDESLLLLRAKLEWDSLPFYVRRKVNRRRPAVDEIPRETVEAVKEHNQLDAELYRFAENRFEEMVEEETSVDATLPRYRRWNRLAQSVAPPLLALYRRGRTLLQDPER